MMARQDDGETPLLQQPDSPEQSMVNLKTPLPWNQFWIILVLQFSDFLVFETLSPFIPEVSVFYSAWKWRLPQLEFIKLIGDIGVTNGDDSQVGYYAGILHSAYYVSQTLTILYWSQLSDYVGRKPLILIASFAIATTMLSFGLSRTFLGLLVSRIICGAFNGENGVVKNLLMDITDATSLPKAYGYLPISWMSAAIIGPLVGGSLSRPADRFPEIFGRSELLKTYPYLLSCTVPAVCASVAWLVTYFYLKESVSTKAPLWESIKEWVLRRSHAKPSTPSSYALTSSGEESNYEEVPPQPLSLRAVLTPKVLTVIASNGTLSLFHIAVSSILSIFFAAPIELGGLSLDPPRIGAIFAISAFASGAFQILFYARLHDRFGAYVILLTGLCSGIPVVILFPVINALARAHGIGLAVWLAVAIQQVLMAIFDMCFACIALFIRASAPNRASIGATNGVIQLVAGGARIIGPASGAAVFSYSMQEGHDAWLAYYFFVTLGFLAVGTSVFLPRDPRLWEERKYYDYR
ncbi:major facilitator superfamily domain-containing protein [Suillus clintonianus]|uniref:major facilitator superfamily domain-containing protein n=1 Tax=Suillus clintonianus TaxID=1904413 RepID=UPI001B87B29C|nr:major facilitator superfamily domain-containing protein [Suillus clintonianus]KAG2146253.1 major facilitator superfamily domain-containing protein [Suillus clintonianus]